MTTNKGIDYSGIGSNVNRDTKTGIRYGVIPTNALFNCGEDLYQDGEDLDYQGYVDQVKHNLRNALEDFFSDYRSHDKELSRLDQAVEDAFEGIRDTLSDNYQGSGDCVRMEYNQDGYKAQTDSSGDAWVFESPYFTYAQFCSPCAPGACYLTNPLAEPDEANKCYCFGHDWFDDEKAPYPVYSVATGELVNP